MIIFFILIWTFVVPICLIFQLVGKENMAPTVRNHVTTVCLRHVTMLKVYVRLKTSVNQVIWVQPFPQAEILNISVRRMSILK
jgi:hypothetical protein